MRSVGGSKRRWRAWPKPHSEQRGGQRRGLSPGPPVPRRTRNNITLSCSACAGSCLGQSSDGGFRVAPPAYAGHVGSGSQRSDFTRSWRLASHPHGGRVAAARPCHHAQDGLLSAPATGSCAEPRVRVSGPAPPEFRRALADPHRRDAPVGTSRAAEHEALVLRQHRRLVNDQGFPSSMVSGVRSRLAMTASASWGGTLQNSSPLSTSKTRYALRDGSSTMGTNFASSPGL